MGFQFILGQNGGGLAGRPAAREFWNLGNLEIRNSGNLGNLGIRNSGNLGNLEIRNSGNLGNLGNPENSGNPWRKVLGHK